MSTWSTFTSIRSIRAARIARLRATGNSSRRPRGTGEGQYPWDLMPDSVMTNATVGKVDQAPQGPVLHVTFKGTESEYTVGPDVPVLANGPGGIKPHLDVRRIEQEASSLNERELIAA